MFQDYKRLKRIEERLDDLERSIKALELEWSNVYDKVRTTLAKLAKREERAATPVPALDGAPMEIAGAVPTSLTDRGREIQRQIMARRNRLAGGDRGILPSSPNGK